MSTVAEPVKERQNQLIEKIFAAQGPEGFWKVIPDTHKYYPDYLHYVPNYKASLWTLILLADLECDPGDPRIQKPLNGVKKHLFDEVSGIYTLQEDHYPIPCLNGNMLYLDCYFNAKPDNRSIRLLEFFTQYQRFDDGQYEEPRNAFCSNTSCYGKHTCYWGVVKLLKGISFIPDKYREKNVLNLRDRCIDFVLKHHVCFSSRKPDRLMISKIDELTFPNFYKGDFLEILWLLKREEVQSPRLEKALNLLRSKESNGAWVLERKMNNMITSIGPVGKQNQFVTKRAKEVLNYY